MLWGYFDESGEAEPATGHLANLTIGGCFAPFGVWQTVSAEWKRLLIAEDVSMFHAADFEHYRGEFEWLLPDGKRDVERHQRFLNGLLDVICGHLRHYVAFGNVPVPQDPRKRFADAYERGIVDVIMHAGKESAFTFEQPISLVFAMHKDFSEDRIRRYHNLINWGDARLAAVAVGRPELLCPLQVADLVAYELSRQQRPNAPDRYPLRRIKQAAESCNVIWSARSWPPR